MIRRLLKNDAETQDAVQDLMMKLWDKKDSLSELENTGAYILRMARNHCLDLMKKKRPLYMGDEKQHRLFDPPDRGGDFDHLEKYGHVRKAIEALPEKYRQVIEYRDIDGFEFEEIKELTGYEAPYIRVLLSRARVMVKTEVQKIYSYENGTASKSS
jgi:RNA polymerase sigma-70 factor (ECF subfamily)